MSDDRSREVMALAILFMVTTTITIGLRLYVRVRIIKAMGSDDWTMLATFAAFTAYLACQLGGVRYGTGRRIDDLRREDAQQALKYWYFCEVFYAPATTLVKVSVGLFLLRIAINKTQIWIIRIFIAGSLLFGIFYLFLIIFQCSPISFWWDLDPASSGTCINALAFTICSYIISALNTSADLAFASLPMFIVWRTSMNRRTRILVCVLLGLASVAGIATIVRFAYLDTLRHYKGDFLWNTTEVAMLSTVEVGLGITAGCAATFRPLVQRWTGTSVGNSYVVSNPAGGLSAGKAVRLRDLKYGAHGASSGHITKDTTYSTTVTRRDSWAESPHMFQTESREALNDKRAGSTVEEDIV